MLELAAIAYDWRGFWSRPSQVPPEDSAWRSWGLCTGRRYGKTRSAAEHVHEEAMSGRAMRIGLIAQNATRTREVMVEGDAGLLAVAPPWERPRFERGRLLWPNGAQAFLYTPETPGDIRGPGQQLAWCSELTAWPVNRRDEAWSNMRLMTTLGYARVIWDTTPKRRHPIIRSLLDRAERSPRLHRVVRGRIRDNVANLAADAIEELEEAYGGTTRGREELDGEYLDDVGAAAIRQEWIEDHRREMPARLERRVIAVDPALSIRKGTDATGIVEGGRGIDGQYYIIEDLSARLPWEIWGETVIERYTRNRLDCVLVERNAGADAVAANIRSCAKDKGLSVELLDWRAKTRHDPKVVYVKEVWARSSKEDRASPCSPLYEKGLVSHVRGADLEQLEEHLTLWEPGDPSPNAMDAAIYILWELADLARKTTDPRRAMAGLGAAQAALQKRAPQAQHVGVGVLQQQRRGRSLSKI